MQKIFVTDMDDVLVDLLGAWSKYLNNRYGTKVLAENIVDWDMTKAFPTLRPNEIYEVLGEEQFWKTVTPKEHAVEYLRLICEDPNYKVYVCTATHYKGIKVKLENCLLKYFPWLTYKDIIMCHNKSLIECDYIVDDYPNNLTNNNRIRFLMNAPHNQICEESLYEFRVKSMKEVYEILKEFEVIESAQSQSSN